MPGQVSPTLRRRELGQRLRDLRLQRKMTLERVAELLLCSPTKISRIEGAGGKVSLQGVSLRGVNLRDVRDLADLYEVDAAEREHLMSLAKRAKERVWWHDYDLPYTTLIELEQSATAIKEFAGGVVPGLLQTPDYGYALGGSSTPELAADELAQHVTVRSTP